MNRTPLDRFVLGTVELGMPYGGRRRKPRAATAIAILQRAYDAGIATFDTAPAYGSAEELLGNAFCGVGDVRIATKVSGDIRQSEPERSFVASLKRLRRSSVHLVQWHSLDVKQATCDRVAAAMTALRARGAEHLGASTYGKRAALAAIHSGWVEYLQVEFSILNQDVVNAVAAAAATRGVKLWARSVLLQGVLAGRWRILPSRLRLLKRRAAEADAIARRANLTLVEASLRFAFGRKELNAVLVGVSGIRELDIAVRAARRGALQEEVAPELARLNLGQAPITNPATWQL